KRSPDRPSLRRLLWRRWFLGLVSRAVAVEARVLPGQEVRDLVLLVLGQEILGAAVAAQAPQVRIGLADLDRLLIGAGQAVVRVAEARELGADRTEHAVVAVAGVALVGLYVPVLVVNRRQRVALRIFQVGNV